MCNNDYICVFGLWINLFLIEICHEVRKRKGNYFILQENHFILVTNILWIFSIFYLKKIFYGFSSTKNRKTLFMVSLFLLKKKSKDQRHSSLCCSESASIFIKWCINELFLPIIISVFQGLE